MRAYTLRIRLSSATLALSGGILLSATVARPLANWGRTILGAFGFEWVIWGLALAVSVLLLLIQILRHHSATAFVAVFACVAAGLAFMQSISLPIERMHILEFGLLGFLVCRDNRNLSPASAIVAAALVGLIVAAADELFQTVLPNRVGDVRDIGFGVFGSACGGILGALISRTGAPADET